MDDKKLFGDKGIDKNIETILKELENTYKVQIRVVSSGDSCNYGIGTKSIILEPINKVKFEDLSTFKLNLIKILTVKNAHYGYRISKLILDINVDEDFFKYNYLSKNMFEESTEDTILKDIEQKEKIYLLEEMVLRNI